MICMERQKILVLGIGNILLRDEGIGIRVIEYLQQRKIPDDVELLDGGTAGADLLDHICGRDKVIVVDAIQADYPPASIVRFGPEDLIPADAPQLSMHSLDLPQTIAMAHMLNCPPKEVIIVGIQPQKVECGMELTAVLQAAVPNIAEFVMSNL